MKTARYRSLELLVLFILLPLSLAIPYSFYAKAGMVLLGLVYVIYVLIKVEGISFKIKERLNWRLFARRTAFIFATIAIITTAYVWAVDKSALFYVPLNNPKLFVFILFIYSLISVWPQEIIYRTFFFNRYGDLFKSEALLIFVNAVLFSLAHIFLRNTLVLVLTFLGGILFGIT
ncbi:MAG: CPBP family intramembrane metalloprotease, partial [Flavobacteriaceae bacterium]|nr:CPBP family intramembrane metalloprotease [Flavobacteriaceae bacterium]